MDDVFSHVVLTIGDEDLGAEHLVAAVGLRLGAGAHRGQVRAGLRLGQVHGAGPLAADELGNIFLLQFFAAGHQQGFNGAVGQHRAQGKRQAGCVQHFGAGRGNQFRKALAAVLDRVNNALPSALRELCVGFLEAGRGRDGTVLEGTRVFVTANIQRCHHAGAELGRLLHHGLGRVEVVVLKTRQGADAGQAREFLHRKQHILEGGLIVHEVLSGSGFKFWVAGARMPVRKPSHRDHGIGLFQELGANVSNVCSALVLAASIFCGAPKLSRREH